MSNLFLMVELNLNLSFIVQKKNDIGNQTATLIFSEN
jgi:hypothetical protein